MTKRTKKLLLSGALLMLIVVLSGCMRYDAAGMPTGIIYEYLVVPTQIAIHWLADLFGGSYGLAILAITIIVRIIIFPLNISQQKKTMSQQIKMSGVQPAISEIQAEIKEAKDPQEKQELQDELVQIYKENNISVMGGLGCLPLLIQLPIFTALFQAINLAPEIKASTFLGIGLGGRSILLAVLAGVVTYFQSALMMVTMPEEQKKQSKSMMLMNPIMILFFSLTGPAGLSLYWIAGGLIAVVQQYIINEYYKPKLEAEMAATHGPQKMVKRKPKTKRATPAQPTAPKAPSSSPFGTKSSSGTKSGKGRNAGKQRRNLPEDES